MNTQNQISMGIGNKQYPQGTHFCLVYRDESLRPYILRKFISSAFLANEKVEYIIDTSNIDELLSWIDSSIPPEVLASRFTISKIDKYIENNIYIPEKMSDIIYHLYAKIQQDGYTGLRMTIEMSWILRGVADQNKLIDAISIFNNILNKYPITIIYQYNANLFDGKTLFDVLKMYPYIIVHGQILHNPCYKFTKIHGSYGR